AGHRPRTGRGGSWPPQTDGFVFLQSPERGQDGGTTRRQWSAPVPLCVRFQRALAGFRRGCDGRGVPRHYRPAGVAATYRQCRRRERRPSRGGVLVSVKIDVVRSSKVLASKLTS